ncbi:MAG: galactokinase [Acidobacteriia bacterium]|nr:galactokinase [Terriglobia bacterium]
MTNAVPGTRVLAQIYAADGMTLARQTDRWGRLLGQFRRRFGESDVHLFSAPGRTEICGNHTDHNHGMVLAAGVDLDSIAVAAPSSDETITVCSEGYGRPFVVALEDLSVVAAERGTTTALIRGIASRFRELGYAAGGFRACLASDVPVGSGLSSSASVEVLIATILNALHNGTQVDAEQIALIGQFAENEYFGKPCGLMDQITCAVGGIVKIDFNDPGAPVVEKIAFDFAASGYSLLVVDTGGSHADLTEDYASIPREMKWVAARFGREVCRQISEQELLNNLAGLRAGVGDRAILRALHFLKENQRVDLQVAALRNKDMQGFLELIEESGNSSYRWLQNCVSARAGTEQGIPLALALAEGFVRRCGGACRVHGGGFAGTIQVFIPCACADEFRTLMESAFGSGCVKILRVRPQGALELKPEDSRQ